MRATVGLLQLLRGDDQPTSAAALRDAIGKAQAEAKAAAARLEALAAKRAEALLTDDDRVLDRIERDLQLATRAADRADLTTAELQRRLAQAAAEENRAELDQVHEVGAAARERGVVLVTKTYPPLAAKLTALAEELVELEAKIAEANTKLERAGDPRRVADIDATARPARPEWGGFRPARLVEQLRLPSAQDGLTMAWPPGIDQWGHPVAPARRTA
jgi:hypothetical protein